MCFRFRRLLFFFRYTVVLTEVSRSLVRLNIQRALVTARVVIAVPHFPGICRVQLMLQDLLYPRFWRGCLQASCRNAVRSLAIRTSPSAVP